MSIRDYLSDEQINKIHSVIRTQCEIAARNDAAERNRVEAALYDRLKKGRKAHDVTGDIYVAMFYPENAIDGLDYQILVEADFLVNLFEDNLSKEAAVNAYQNIFKTETGKRICKEMFAL